VSAVEEGCANRREQVASQGSGRGGEDAQASGDEPRPTRGQRAQDLRPRRAAPAASAPATPAGEAGAAE
jgi:hypothetical protein